MDWLKFSVVTPSLNQGRYIGETIESVLTQAGDFEIEYILQDGGSTDESLEVIKKAAADLAAGSRPVRCRGVTLQWESRPDKGQSEAINKAFQKATGDIFCYLNSDDTFNPDALDRVAREFAAHPEIDFVHGDCDFIDENSRIMWEWLSRPYRYQVMASYHFLWNRFTNYIVQPSTFWRRRVRERIGPFDESFHYAMDYEYWVRAGSRGLTFRHLPVKLSNYRFISGTKGLSSPTIFWEDSLETYRRYRGSPSLARLLAYYYYNLGLEFNFEAGPVHQKFDSLFKRWENLPAAEQSRLHQQAEKGRPRAYLLCAGFLSRRGRWEEASRYYRLALRTSRGFSLHPLAFPYYLRKISVWKLAPLLERLTYASILMYREIRYEYRYKNNLKRIWDELSL